MINPNKTSKNKKTSPNSSPAFTIVELLVVIVVIAILATITIVSYSGITKQATVASVQANLKQLMTAVDLDHAANDTYPAESSAINSGKGFSTTSGIAYVYNPLDNNTSYCASVTSTTQYGITYHYTPRDGQVEPGDCGSLALSCPSGFIPVPGSSTYNTSNFCVMKYEAKHNADNIAVSTAAGLPWTYISQTVYAMTYSTTACTGCHLITEAEWMTIAQNVLGVASNWSGGAVGSGYVYSGNNDGNPGPGSPLAASTNDNDGYYGTGNSSSDTTVTDGMVGKSQRRTLALSNGEVIWDLAGNVLEWTSGQTNSTTAQQPGVSGTGWGWREWTAITTPGSLPINPSPSGIGIAGASNWNSSKGIGQIFSSSDTSISAFVRGGAAGYGNVSGVLGLDLNDGNAWEYQGFRVTR